jgi:hypothetical protein
MDDYLDKIHGGKLGSTDIHVDLHNQYFGQFEKYAQSGFGKKFDYKDPDLRDVKIGIVSATTSMTLPPTNNTP